MKKKLAIKWTVIFIILLTLSYFVVNGISLYSYKFDQNYYNNKAKNLVFKDTIKITKSAPLNPDEYLSFKNIKVKNYFKDFKIENTLASNNSIIYILHNDKNEHIAVFWISISDTYIDKFKSNLYMDDQKIDKLNGVNREKILNENNINNDIDLFRFLEKKKYINNNIFTNINKMKENYLINLFVEYNFQKDNSSTLALIEGDYDGYVSEIKEIGLKRYFLIYNKKLYSFTFTGEDYFTDNYISEILNTIVIE